MYNTPITRKVNALIFDDMDNFRRYILIKSKARLVKHISVLHLLYLALQYPLIFPYAKDGYRVGILHHESIEKLSNTRCKLMMRELFSYRN